jgi:hypothetical protein
MILSSLPSVPLSALKRKDKSKAKKAKGGPLLNAKAMINKKKGDGDDDVVSLTTSKVNKKTDDDDDDDFKAKKKTNQPATTRNNSNSHHAKKKLPGTAFGRAHMTMGCGFLFLLIRK